MSAALFPFDVGLALRAQEAVVPHLLKTSGQGVLQKPASEQLACWTGCAHCHLPDCVAVLATVCRAENVLVEAKLCLRFRNPGEHRPRSRTFQTGSVCLMKLFEQRVNVFRSSGSQGDSSFSLATICSGVGRSLKFVARFAYCSTPSRSMINVAGRLLCST